MKKLNQQGVAHVLMILLVIVVIGVIAGAGYVVYNKSKSKPSTKTTVSTSKVTTSSSGSTQSSTPTAGKTLEIKEMSVKVADPDNRGITYVTEDKENPDGTMVKIVMIRDNDSAYYAKCSYPASLLKVTESTAKSSTKPVKKIGTQWYEVGNGSHTQSACELKGDESAYKTYEDGIRQYIADNLSAL